MLLSGMTDELIYVIENKGYTDFSPCSLGKEICKPGKFFGFVMRDYYLIHFIVSGTGVFENPNGKVQVNSGQAFLIRPGESCRYTADENSPWTYMWIGFNGELAKRFDNIPDVFDVDGKIFDEISRTFDMETGAEESLAAILFKLCAELSSIKPKRDYVKWITDFIDINYMRDIRVCDIADMLHIDRKYLARIFKEKKGVSIKQYLTDTRMREAKKLLKDGYRVGETAALVGYSDGFIFSKAYKKYFGTAPKEHKKRGLSKKV